MLKIKTTNDKLLGPLQQVTGIVERRHTLPELAREVFPGAAAYRDAELMGFVMPRLRRMRSLDFVRIERMGPDMAASISMRGIEFMERQPQVT